MRFLLFSVALIAISVALANATAIPANDDFEVFNDLWLVKQDDDDHVTYKRRQPITTTTTTTTTTTPAPTTRPPPRTTRPPRPIQTPLNAAGAGGRVQAAGNQRRIGGLQKKSLSIRARTTTNHAAQDPHNGDYLWMVSHRSDDSITYTRRGNSTTNETSTAKKSGQRQKWNQGTLRSWGTGLDAVYARVVDTRSGEHLTEESVQIDRRLKSNTRKSRPSNVPASNSLDTIEERVSTERDEYPRIGEKVNGWRVSGKTVNNISWERIREGEVSTTASTVTVGGARTPTDVEHRLLPRNQTQASSAAGLENENDGEPPHIGDEIDGWRVVSKSRNHIKWERAGVTTTTTAAPALHLRSGDDYYDNYDENENEVNVADSEVRGIARTSNETNYKIGDELAGWKVVGRDYRGLIWEKCKNTTETPTTTTTTTTTPASVLRPGSRLRLKSGGGRRPRPENSQQLKSGDFTLVQKPTGEKVIYLRSLSNSDENDESSSQERRQPQKTPRSGWYLKEESLNHITWQKDDVDPSAEWSFNDTPIIGHQQAGWEVQNKSRSHIQWKRVGRHASSEENSPEWW